MGIPWISLAEEEGSFHVLLWFQVEVQRKAYMCVILKLSTVLFLAKRGLSYYPS